MEENTKVHTDLLQSCISQFEDIYNGNQTSIRFNNRKVEIVSIYSHGEFQAPTTIFYIKKGSLCIFFNASWTLVVGGAVSG
jgi:hypothetical protein